MLIGSVTWFGRQPQLLVLHPPGLTFLFQIYSIAMAKGYFKTISSYTCVNSSHSAGHTMWNLCWQHMRKTSKGFYIHLRLERPERQMGTQGVHTKGVFPRLVRASRCTRTSYFYLALAAQVSPIQNILLHYFTSFVPIGQQAGQAIVPRHLISLIFISVSAGDPGVMCPIWKSLCSNIGYNEVEG
jgi:hypothetical protein